MASERVDGRSGKETQGVFGAALRSDDTPDGSLDMQARANLGSTRGYRSLDPVYRMGRQRVATPECKLALVRRGGLLTSRRR